MERSTENVIEWLNGQDIAVLTLSERRYISRVKKLNASNSGVTDYHTNPDGTIYARVPLDWIRITPPKKMNLSEEERQKRAERMKKAHISKI